MSKIIVNDECNIEGKLSLAIKKDDSSTPIIISYSGVLASDDYIEDIQKLETDRFVVDSVNVHYESMGSESEEILYEFAAKSITIKR